MSTSKAREVLDFRFGGAVNVLAVDVRPFNIHEGEWMRQFWVVDYDRWRDERWSVGRAYSLVHDGRSNETPIIMRLFAHQVMAAAEYAKVLHSERTPCHLCRNFGCMTLRGDGGGFETVPNRPDDEQPHPRLAGGQCLKGHDMKVKELNCRHFEDVDP